MTVFPVAVNVNLIIFENVINSCKQKLNFILIIIRPLVVLLVYMWVAGIPITLLRTTTRMYNI